MQAGFSSSAHRQTQDVPPFPGLLNIIAYATQIGAPGGECNDY
jgi:hypothetical protein